MPLVPAADFLAGALLTLLLPAALLISLVVWYTLFIKRAPDPADGSEPGGSATDTAKSAPSADVPPPNEG